MEANRTESVNRPVNRRSYSFRTKPEIRDGGFRPKNGKRNLNAAGMTAVCACTARTRIIFFNKESNDAAAHFVHSKIRELFGITSIAEHLMPKEYPLGTKRLW